MSMPSLIGRIAAGIAVCVVSIVATACTEEAPIAGPPSEPPAFGKGTFDGPKSVPLRGRMLVTSIVTGSNEIYSMNEDGSDVVRLTYEGSNGLATYSPDASKIVFSSYRNGTVDLYSMNPDGSGLKKLTAVGPNQGAGLASWSPDGKKIAFAINDNLTNESRIFIMNASGSNLSQLVPTGPPGTRDFTPAFSPDGKTVAFGSNRGGNGMQVWSIDLATKQLAQVTACAVNVSCFLPAWSPDGSSLAYTAGSTIEAIELQFNTKYTLVADGYWPVWSPDGMRLGYTHGTGLQSIATVSAVGWDVQELGNLGFTANLTGWGRR